MVTISEPKAPVTEKKLVAVERRLGICLPQEYRAFLLKTNGGYPEPAVFAYGTRAYEDSSVHYFLSVHNGPYSNFEESFHTFKVTQRRMPDALVPIAYDEGGNQICISVGTSDNGAIYFWDHEEEVDLEDADSTGSEKEMMRNVHLIAPSLGEFLDGLRDDVRLARKAWKERMQQTGPLKDRPKKPKAR